jgi:tripartite-type tricarboxylate transporter receptor subunit TctC
MTRQQSNGGATSRKTLFKIPFNGGICRGGQLMTLEYHVRYTMLVIILVAAVIGLPLCDVLLAAEQSPFYQGKIVRVVVGTAPGGGFDVYARAIARHWGKYIPGNPQVIIENQPGAATLVAAKNVFQAKPDGLTIGTFIADIALGRLFNQPGVDFDFQKFEWLGVPVKDNIVCALTKASGITSIEAWKASKTPVKLGGTGRLIVPDNTALVLKHVVGLPIQLVSGYSGTAPIRLAAESGELAGGCWQWESIKPTWRAALQDGTVNIVVQLTAEPLPELPKVPLALNLVQSDEARKLITASVQTTAPITRLYALPPGTPKDRVRILQKSFMETMRDSDFLSEAKKSNLEIDPTSGEDAGKAIDSLFHLEPALVAKMKAILLGD